MDFGSQPYSPHGTSPYIADLALLNQVMKGLHRFFNRRIVVEAVDLEKVDIVGIKPFQRCLYHVEDCSPGQAVLINVILGLSYGITVEEMAHVGRLADTPKALGHDDDLLPRDAIFLDRLANNNLASTLRVGVCGVPGVQSPIISRLEERKRLI